MPYIKRDSKGNIQAISLLKSNDFTEAISAQQDAIQLIALMVGQKDIEAIASDLEMARVIEDLIDVLVTKSIISYVDLPQPVQLKLLKRKNFRNQGLFSTTNNELINL